MNVYFDSLYNIYGDSIYEGEGSEYNDYMRFMNFYEPRLSTNIGFEEYFMSFTNQPIPQALQTNWNDIGPDNSLSTGIGPTEFISIFDNGTPILCNYMLTGSLTGGLFYSDDAGSTWNPAGSDT
ncbi:MAG: hypothetical protein JXR53_06190 [Bacteroidales bacterium]|nr:hypothetical protein [Bacteroidales bacterium]